MNFNSKKYTILLAIICVIFIGFIVKAFDYLPDKSVQTNPNINIQRRQNIAEKTKNNDDLDDEEDNNSNSNNDDSRHKSGHIDFMKKSNSPSKYNQQLDEIQAPNGINEENISQNNGYSQNSSLSPDEQALKYILNGRQYKQNSNFDDALSEFEKVSNVTNNKEILAMSYESIAEIYANMRRFGQALTYANKAYNSSPSSYREMLIARIYYQSGDTDAANIRMNNILSKNFND